MHEAIAIMAPEPRGAAKRSFCRGRLLAHVFCPKMKTSLSPIRPLEDNQAPGLTEHDHGLRRRRQSLDLAAGESRGASHRLQLLRGPGIAFGRAAEHDESEHRRKRRAHAIVVRNHLDHENSASGNERPAGALEQIDASFAVEMMKE